MSMSAIERLAYLEDCPTRKQGTLDEGEKGQILDLARHRLLGQAPDLPEYPDDGLGPLAPVARAIAEEGQMDVALAGQSVLGAAALCAQAVASVETLTGADPLALYLLTIADSGAGKTLAESAALAAVRSHQRARAKTYRAALRAWQQSGQDEDPPCAPFLLMEDATIEGVRRAFLEGPPSQALFSSEAAVVLTGHGMQREHRAKTAGALNALWDRGEISVMRATTGRTQLYDRRLVIHFMIQPSAVQELLLDPLLSDIGLWPRFLLAWPEPAPPRKAMLFRPEENAAIGAFWKRCTELLQAADQAACEDLPVLRLNERARRLLIPFFEGMECAAKKEGGRYANALRPFALRATQLACRIAGVLSVFDGAEDVGPQHMLAGQKLAVYSLESWRSAFGDREHLATAKNAIRLLEWMLSKRDGRATETDMIKNGPKPRSRSLRDAALALLHAAGIVTQSRSRPPAWTVKPLGEISEAKGSKYLDTYRQ